MKIERVTVSPEELAKLTDGISVESVTITIRLDFDDRERGVSGSITAGQRLRPKDVSPDGSAAVWTPQQAQLADWKMFEKMLAGIKGKASVLGLATKGANLEQYFANVQRRYSVVFKAMTGQETEATHA